MNSSTSGKGDGWVCVLLFITLKRNKFSGGDNLNLPNDIPVLKYWHD